MNAKTMNAIVNQMLVWIATAISSTATVAGAKYAIISTFGGDVVAMFTGNLAANAKNLTAEDKKNHRITVTWSPSSSLGDLLCSHATRIQDQVTNPMGYASVGWMEEQVDNLLDCFTNRGNELFGYIKSNSGLGGIRVEKNAKEGRYSKMSSVGSGQTAWAKDGLDLATIQLDKFLKGGNSMKAWKGKTLGDMIASIGDASVLDPNWTAFQSGGGIDHGEVIDLADL